MENELVALTPAQQIKGGMLALRELKHIVKTRPDKLVIKGKQYLFFTDYQMLGAFFGVTAYVTETRAITKLITSESGAEFLEVIGYHARAVAKKDGKDISAAEAECLAEEPNWKGKERFAMLSMAQTRACAKCLRNVLSWIVKLPDTMERTLFAEEAIEEVKEYQV